MRIEVRQDAGRRFNAFGRRVEDIVRETAPLIETATALPLPDPAVLRLVTHRMLLSSVNRRNMRLLMSESDELGVNRSERLAGIRVMASRIRYVKRNWTGIGAMTTDFEEGQPEVYIVPEALAHADLLDDTDFLHKMVAHELAHLVQHRVSNGLYFTVPATPFPERRDIVGAQFGALLEGHAVWTDQQITTKALGYVIPMGRTGEKASRKYRRARQRTQGEREAAFETYERHAQQVGAVIDLVGIDLFNRLWTDIRLVPTFYVLNHPEIWAEKIKAEVTENRPARASEELPAYGTVTHPGPVHERRRSGSTAPST